MNLPEPTEEGRQIVQATTDMTRDHAKNITQARYYIATAAIAIDDERFDAACKYLDNAWNALLTEREKTQ